MSSIARGFAAVQGRLKEYNEAQRAINRKSNEALMRSYREKIEHLVPHKYKYLLNRGIGYDGSVDGILEQIASMEAAEQREARRSAAEKKSHNEHYGNHRRERHTKTYPVAYQPSYYKMNHFKDFTTLQPYMTGENGKIKYISLAKKNIIGSTNENSTDFPAGEVVSLPEEAYQGTSRLQEGDYDIVGENKRLQVRLDKAVHGREPIVKVRKIPISAPSSNNYGRSSRRNRANIQNRGHSRSRSPGPRRGGTRRHKRSKRVTRRR